MEKLAKLSLLIVIVGFAQLGCDSVTDPNTGDTNSSTNFNSEISYGTEDDETVIIVDDENLEADWEWALETGETGFGEFVNGPGTPTVGSGSARFVLENENDGLALIGAIFDDAVPLTDINQLEYSTYQTSATDAQSVSLQFNVNYDGGQEWQGRLVFEAYYEGDLELNEWQTWNTLTQRGWWASGAPGSETCSIDAPCTFQEILNEYPDAVVRSETELEGKGLIIFKAGSGWGLFDGNVDGFSISINEEEFTYSFEAEEEDNGDEEDNGEEENGEGEEENGEDPANPANIEDCKNGGWADYGFKNQGQCVRFVNTGKDSRDESQDSDENGEEEDNNNENGEDPANPANIEDCKNGGWADYGFKNQGQCVRFVNTGKDSRNESQDSDENGEEGDNGDENDNGENGNEDGENGESNNEDNDETGDNTETTSSGNSPASAEDCKNGGWQDYGFKNQGQCIRSVNNGG